MATREPAPDLVTTTLPQGGGKPMTACVVLAPVAPVLASRVLEGPSVRRANTKP